MDISGFMSWFVSQVINMFSYIFNLLDNITFAGTSVLKVIITIVILAPLLGVVLTLSQSATVIGQRSEKIERQKERAERKNKNANKSSS